VLYGCDFVDGYEVFDDHVDEFELSDDGAVLFLEFLSLLDHELLDVVVGLVGGFEFVVYFCELFAAVFDLFF
jgi:hypothetical protein